MIKFFRRIRQKLLSENKFSKYLLYAFGEIVLVVIGILIALQINTWNSLQIESKKEKEYLNSIIEDIKIQSILVKGQIKHEVKMRQKCEMALEHLNTFNVNTDSLNLYLADITRKSFVVNDPTFQDLKSSGNLLIIKNHTLRKKIISFYQYLNYTALVVQTGNENVVAGFRDFLLKYSVVDMNYQEDVKVAGDVDWSLKSVNASWATSIQKKNFKDEEYLFMVLNHISQRGRVSSVNLDLMQRMQKRIEEMKSELEKYSMQ